MNYQRKHPRGAHTRNNSSDWRYPPLERGSSKRGKYSVAKWIARAMESFKEWKYGHS